MSFVCFFYWVSIQELYIVFPYGELLAAGIFLLKLFIERGHPCTNQCTKSLRKKNIKTN